VALTDPASSWPDGRCGVVLLRSADGAEPAQRFWGSLEISFPWASVTKVAVAMAVLVAVEEETLGLDDQVGPRGASVRQLLSHAGGVAPSEHRSLAEPGTRRIYSNAGFEILADALAQAAGLSFETYLHDAVLAPLSMSTTRLEGSAASGLVGTVAELGHLLGELLEPTLLAPATMAEMQRVQGPDLAGVLPGFGRFSPCPWGLGVEVKGDKTPHWSGSSWGPNCVGHFGQRGGFLLIDSAAKIGVGALADLPFGRWAAESWPTMLDGLRADAQGVDH